MSTLAVARPGVSPGGVLDGAGASGGGDGEAGRRHEAGIDGGLGQAPDAVAAHLRLAAVGVAQLHGEVTAVAARPDPDDAVGPDATAPIGQQAHLGHREPDGVVGVQHDQEVVARPLVLGRPHHTILAAGVVQPCTSSASSSRAWASALLPAQLTRGSRRNHEAWRRANWRVRRTACSRQSDRGAPLLHVGQDLAVAQRLAGRAREARRTGGQHPHLLDQPALDHAAEPVLRSAASISSGGTGEADLRRAALGIGLEPGSERREGSARPERDLQGADDPPAIGRLHPRRTPPDRARRGGRAGRPARRDPRPAQPPEQPPRRGSGPGSRDRRRRRAGRGRYRRPAARDGPAARCPPAPRAPPAWNCGHGEVLVRIDQVEQVVRHGGPRLGPRLRCADVHAAVDAHGIDRDDFAVAPAQGELQRGLRFPRGRDPDECDRRQALATGMRTRCRGRATTSSRRPERWWGWPSVTVTRAKAPAAGFPAVVPAGKWISLPCRVRPGQHRLVAPADPFDQRLFAAADARLVAGQGGTVHHGLEALEAFGDDVRRHEAGLHVGGPGARAAARR